MWTVVAREQGALLGLPPEEFTRQRRAQVPLGRLERPEDVANVIAFLAGSRAAYIDRKSTRLNSSHLVISYAVFCLKKKNKQTITHRGQEPQNPRPHRRKHPRGNRHYVSYPRHILRKLHLYAWLLPRLQTPEPDEPV